MHTKTEYRLKFPEEIEIENKETELERLKDTHRARKETLAKLRLELRTFERVYHLVLGVRIAELDALEARLCGAEEDGEDGGDESGSHQAGEWSGHLHASELIHDDESVTGKSSSSLKSLFREVAKTIHPDLAINDEDRKRREELMSFANSAYASDDRGALEQILREWEESSGKFRGKDLGAYLVKLIRVISQERNNIQVIDEQIDALKATDTYVFKMRVDDALGKGIDLLAEMAATVDLDIASARKRLSAMKGEPLSSEIAGPQAHTRFIRFPADLSCGVLYTRNRESINYCDWQKLCNAKGARAIPVNMAVRLDVRGDLTPDLRFLQSLQPDDLQALFMYEVTDSALEYITHLTGLEELYLSDSAVTDEGIGRLELLTNLKRIYLYHIAISDSGIIPLYRLKKLSQFTCSGTMISETGLASLQKAIPAVKTLSFPWRYGKKS